MENVSVVIPALNEPYLSTLLTKLQDYEVIVRKDKGLTYAVWKGIKEAKGNIIAVLDGDGSHPPESIPKMRKLLNENTQLVIGSRYCQGGYSRDSIIRKVISRFYCLLAQIVLRTRIKDCMSGFWVGYKTAYIFNPSNTYKFGLQLIQNYSKNISEYPIIFRKRRSGKSHVKPLPAIQDLFAIFGKQTNSK